MNIFEAKEARKEAYLKVFNKERSRTCKKAAQQLNRWSRRLKSQTGCSMK